MQYLSKNNANSIMDIFQDVMDEFYMRRDSISSSHFALDMSNRTHKRPEPRYILVFKDICGEYLKTPSEEMNFISIVFYADDIVSKDIEKYCNVNIVPRIKKIGYSIRDSRFRAQGELYQSLKYDIFPSDFIQDR